MERAEMKSTLLLLAALLALTPARAEPRNPLDALQLGALTATRERPLFRPSRRPPPPAAVATPAPEPPPPDERPVALEPPPFDLLGAVVGADVAIALLRNRATGEVLRLRQGEDAAGWRVGTIERRTVTLEREGVRQSLALSAPLAAPAESTSEAQSTQPADPNRVAQHARPDP
jgi:general secretion pathway protein N